MEFKELIVKRHATRKFQDKKVEKEKIEAILEAGRVAPTAKNQQPIKIYVLESEDALLKVDKASPCRYGAPTVLMVCGDVDASFVKGGVPKYEMDACIVATHMMLAATNESVQNIWIEFFDEDILRGEFLIPSNLKPVCLIPIGYEAEDCPVNVNHEKRKELSEIVEYR